ncbi:MAG TPA: RING finger protein [Planctomycetota bacterium]|nr:RING finger protein [Planctomycetota bacterium]
MNEGFGTLAGLLFAAFLVWIFIWGIRGYSTPEIPAGTYDAWTLAARALGGRFSPAGGRFHSRIDLLICGRIAFFQFVVMDGPSLKGDTSVRVNVIGLSPGRLTVGSTGRKQLPSGIIDAHPPFDEFFAPTRTDSRSPASRLLGASTKETIAASLYALRRFGEVTVSLEKEALTVEVGTLLVQESALRELASATEIILKAYFGPAAAFPIELVEVPNLEGAHCSICRSELREEIVRCLACQTPHHADCWRFNSRCSTYGCGETRFTSESPLPS